jgi:FkbM family methyltransferase
VSALHTTIHEQARRRPALRRTVRRLRRARRGAHELLGSDRHSHPSELDRQLAEYLPQHGGVFVEAGAYDGYSDSTTYWLERFRAWSGVLVEPVPEYAEQARRERPRSKVFHCALVPDERDSVTVAVGGTMSLVPGARGSDAADRDHTLLGARLQSRETYEVAVPARTLTSVLDEARVDRIDFFSLDVEGFEEQVLRGLDLDRYRPRLLLVEMLDEREQRPRIEALLGERYEHVRTLSPRDHLYRVAGGRVA